MRILQIGKYYHPFKGGIETVVQTISEGLVQSGHSVTVLCANTKKEKEEDEINGVRVIRLPSHGILLSTPLVPTFRKEVLALCSQFDLVHLHSPNPFGELAALFLPPEIPLVITHHSDVVRQSWLLPLYGPFYQKVLKRADQVLVASPQVQNSHLLHTVKKKTHVIPFGLEPKQFELSETEQAIVQDLRTTHGNFGIFIGRLVGYKGVSVLLDAVKRKKTKVLVIGDGPDRESLQAQAKSLRIENQVSFLGSIEDRRQLICYLHAARYLVLPSISSNEAYGMVLLEAMACGTPVVSTTLPTGVSFVNQEWESGLTATPGNPLELSRAISRLANEDILQKRLADGAKERFFSLFTTEKMISAYIDCFSSLLGLQSEATRHRL